MILICKMLEILYHDVHLIAINKPPGLLVHRSPIARDVSEFAVQTLRNQIGQKVFPTHRLDRKTSGVLLFALTPEINARVMKLFAEKLMEKSYVAIVRGYTEDHGRIDYPLKHESGKLQEAISEYVTLGRSEINVSFGKHKTSRYSLVSISPKTGRKHQIRKHFAHIMHPIIGDRPHGCNKQNRLFKDRWGMTDMLLHAEALNFVHPATGQPIALHATPSATFMQMLSLMSFSLPAPKDQPYRTETP